MCLIDRYRDKKNVRNLVLCLMPLTQIPGVQLSFSSENANPYDSVEVLGPRASCVFWNQ